MCMRNLNQTESELHFQDGLLAGNDNENLMEEFQEGDGRHIQYHSDQINQVNQQNQSQHYSG